MKQRNPRGAENVRRVIKEVEEHAARVATSARHVKNGHERRIWEEHARTLKREAEEMKERAERKPVGPSPDLIPKQEKRREVLNRFN